DTRTIRHIARLARQQQEHAHRFAPGMRGDLGAIAVARIDAAADRGHDAIVAPAPAERHCVIDRAAAGIQHDGGATKLTLACELVEFFRGVGGYDTDRADPAAAVRPTGDPAEL